MDDEPASRLLTLTGTQLVARIDEIGCRIASLVHRGTGRELLFVAPWSRRPLADGPVTNESWVEHWPGGWDVLVPNAGAPSTVAGVAHGFHGEASVEVWRMETAGPTAAIGRWRDRTGLAVERSIRVDGARLRVESIVTNPTSTPVPFLWVEHLILDAGLLGSGARLDLSGRVVALGDSRGPTDGWDAFEPWPTVRRHGSLEDWGRLPPAGSARLGALREVRPPVGISGTNGTSVKLRWSVDVLPFLWLWIENRAATLPDGLTINCVGLEPANTASGEGLAASLERGEGQLLAPDGRWTSWIELDVDVSPAG